MLELRNEDADYRKAYPPLERILNLLILHGQERCYVAFARVIYSEHTQHDRVGCALYHQCHP